MKIELVLQQLCPCCGANVAFGEPGQVVATTIKPELSLCPNCNQPVYEEVK